MRYLIAAWWLLTASLMLEGCVHTAPPSPHVCIPLRAWTQDEKTALKAAFDSLPSGSILGLAVEDLQKMRAEAKRACGG